MPHAARSAELLLPPNPAQARNALNAGAAWIVDIAPLMFLRLTDARHYFSTAESLMRDAKPLAFYLSPEVQENMTVHPFLDVDLKTGRIRSHEGRHRAAAVHNAGGDRYRIAIYSVPKDRLVRPEEFPRVWTNQYRNDYEVNILRAVHEGAMHIVTDRLQEQYWNEDDED